MLMAMMEVRIVRMLVPKRLMPMPMRMRLRHRPVVRMSMVLVMDVPVFVLDRIVRMLMIVAFGQM